MKKRIRVLIVDDSALVRRLLTDMLSSARSIEVLGAAGDAYGARAKIKSLNPDVLTLDVEMPKMDGVTFLKNLMRLRPMPVVMISSLTEHGAAITLDALAAGAVDYLPKPKIDLAATLTAYRAELIEKIQTAAVARVRAIPSATLVATPSHGAEAVLPKAAPRPLNACCRMAVCEARDGQQVLPGHVYIAPGDRHLLLVRDGARYVCKLDDGMPVNRHKPSVDVLFRSVAQQAGGNAVGVILTGMGKDGAIGLGEMREAGACTLAQDEATSVVWGMPGEAVALGAVGQVMPLGSISGAVQRATAEEALEQRTRPVRPYSLS